MHLTEVGGCLRTQSNCDLRLAQIFPKGQYMKAKRPRLSEFLMKENLLEFFRVQESKLRQSEKVRYCLFIWYRAISNLISADVLQVTLEFVCEYCTRMCIRSKNLAC